MANPSAITILTEPIGSFPRPVDVLSRESQKATARIPISIVSMKKRLDTRLSDLMAAGSPVVTDGEQRTYHNFATYCVHGIPNTARMFKFLFSDAHTPSPLAAHTWPFPLHAVADYYLDAAMCYAAKPWLIQLQQKS